MPLNPKHMNEAITKGTEKQSLLDTIKSIPDSIEHVFETMSNVIDWIKNIPEHIANFSVNLIADVYNLTSQLILKTPLWLFDNQWFENTTYLFSILAIGVVTILTMIEGFKRKFQKKSVDVATIGKRWFFVAGLTTIIPFIVYNFFKLLNYLSDLIIGIGSHTMKNPIMDSLTAFDVFVLLVFSVALIVIAIPTLLKNARRFFDILLLILVSPLALVGYIFEPYNHLYKQWWENLKRLSLVQTVYAFFLLIIGLLIYGLPTPDDVWGALFKFLIVLGGFFRLMNPPQFVQKYLDPGEGIDQTVGKQWNAVKEGFSKHVAKGKTVIGKGVSAVKFLSRGRTVQLVNPPKPTRMSKYHGR